MGSESHPHHPSSVSTLPRRHRKITVLDPSDSLMVMLRCRLNRN